jgi:hypothetical protein
VSGKIYGNLKCTQERSCLNLCFQQLDNKHVNIVIFITVIYVTAKPTLKKVVFLRSLKERVRSVHITYILHLINHFDSEDGSYKFLQNFVKNLSLPHCAKIPERIST